LALAKTKLNVLVFFLVLLLDQATKRVVCHYLHEGVPIIIIPKIFNVTLGFNAGAAFGMFSQLPDYWRWLALILTILIASLVLFWFIIKKIKSDRIAQVAISGILAGAVSNNIIDRFRFDAAVDFLDFYWTRHHWPTFNMADSIIFIGAVVLILQFVRAGHVR
jgi:signal peptidase II